MFNAATVNAKIFEKSKFHLAIQTSLELTVRIRSVLNNDAWPATMACPLMTINDITLYHPNDSKFKDIQCTEDYCMCEVYDIN